jgi:hypothetical protein
MLVATFGPSTTWVGKTVTYADGAFVLEDHGPIRAQDVFEYERQGHLVWAMDGVRAWVGAKAQEEGGLVAAPTPSSDWGQRATEATPAEEAEAAPVEAEPEPQPVPMPAADPVPEVAESAPEFAESAGLEPVAVPATSVAVVAIAEPVLTEAVPEATVTEPGAEVTSIEPVAEQRAEADAAEVAETVAAPALSAEDAGPVLASEPEDLAGIAAAAASEMGADAAPAVPDPIEDAFAGLGADDPARARAIEEAARRHDWTRLTALYALQAWWLDEEGRDALQVTRLARRSELRAFLDQGVTMVRVKAADDDTCDACRRVAGRVMTIADALRLMPIPDASCAYKWCRCLWEPADPVPSP